MVEKPVVTIQEVIKPCLSEPLRDLPPVPAPTICQPDTVCFKAADANQLADNIEALQDRVAADWARCGVAPSP